MISSYQCVTLAKVLNLSEPWIPYLHVTEKKGKILDYDYLHPPPPTHTPSLKDGEVDLEILGENALERKHLLYLLHHYFHSGSLGQEDLLE